jgi:hypothetical protein
MVMSLTDKFGIIENHIKQDDKKKLTGKIENYFENYLSSDIKVLIPDYVNQVIWFEGINFDNFSINIDSHIKNYLISRRNNMRSYIKKDSFDLKGLNKFLKNFISKLEYLNNIIKSTDDKVIKEGLKQLTNLIISDSIILLFIEEQIVMFNSDVRSDIEILIKLTKSLGKYDNNETHQWMLKTTSNIFKKQVVNIEDPPLPENIRRIQKLNQTLHFITRIKNYFKFIDEDITSLSSPIHDLVIEYLNDIIKNNSLNEIEFVFDKTWPNIKKSIMTNNFEGKTDNINSISNEIISLIDRTIKLNDVKQTFQLINILKFTDELIGNQTNKEIINQKIANTMESEDLQESIHLNINDLIIQGKDKDVVKLLDFVTNVKDKDVFITKYYLFLIKRLMTRISEIDPKKMEQSKSEVAKYIETEKNIYDYLKIKFGDKLVYKINKVITDTEFSYDDNVNFNNIDIRNFENKMTVITTSYNNWDVNQNEGLVNNSIIDSIKNTELGKHLRNYQKYYELRYSNKRVINWFPHFGEVNITYLNQNIRMLPIQFMVLEMFNDKDKITIELVNKATFFSNYTSKFANDIIGSLVSGGILKINNDNIELASSGEIKNDMIEIFFTQSDYASVWEQNRNQELAHTRQEIISSNINHILKQQSKTREELYEIVKQSIKVFELDQDTFVKSVEHMISMDYINLEGQHLVKLYF